MTLLTAEQAAARLSITERTVRRWVAQGKMAATHPTHGHTSKVLIDEQEVARLAHEMEQERQQLAEASEQDTRDTSTGLTFRLDAMETLVEGMEQRLERVEQLLQDLAQERPPQLSIVRTAPVEHQVQASTLPGDLVTATSFAKTHGIAESTLKRAIADGRLHATPGSWHVGRVIVKWALDAAGRAQFYELYHNHPKFVACPDCPHSPS